MGFGNLRGRSRQSLQEKVEKLDSTGQTYKDETLWNISTDKAGTGMAVIRFLPEPPVAENSDEIEEDAIVKLYQHGFKHRGKWFIENCPTTIGLDCPVCEMNSELWNSSEDPKDPLKDVVRNRKRKQNFYSNVYVVKDPGNPEAEGKVWRFRYGVKIYNKIKAVLMPEVPGVEGYNPFDLWEGASFQIVTKKVAGFPNYDDSRFLDRGQLAQTDDQMESIWRQSHSLAEIVSEDKFKNYDQLKEALNRVLGIKGTTTTMGSSQSRQSEPESPTETTQSMARETPTASSQEAPFEGDSDDPFAALEQAMRD